LKGGRHTDAAGPGIETAPSHYIALAASRVMSLC
jgi:hypothetical protein